MLDLVLPALGGVPVSPLEFYSDLYKVGLGFIQKSGEKGHLKGNPVGYRHDKDGKGRFVILFEDTLEENLQILMEATDFSILSGCTYYGRRNVQEHAAKMHSLIFDLDGVTEESLSRMLFGMRGPTPVYPYPNYIVSSGHGVHLYYVFEEPVSLFPYTKIAIKSLKHALTKILWNPNTSEEKNVQFQGINQGFRVVGSLNYKNPDNPYTLQAFRFNEHPVTLKELNSYVMPEDRVDESRLFEERNFTWSEAKAKFPQWADQFETEEEYQERGGHGLHQRKTEAKKWHLKRSVYDWWKKKMWASTVYGRRYFNVMILVIYAIKCQYDPELNPTGVTRDELEADIKAIQPKLTAINPEFPFTDNDIQSALECYDLRYATFPIESIEKLSGAVIQRNKRNGRTQADHLKLARFIRDEINGHRDNWDANNGRQSKKAVVEEYRRLHPEARQCDCVRETGLGKATVSRHWASSTYKGVGN